MSQTAWRVVVTYLVVGLSGMAMSASGVRAELEAKPGDATPNMTERRLQFFKETLTLNDAQQGAVKKLLQGYDARRVQLRAELDKLQQAEDKDINAVLTAEQQPKFARLKQQQMELRQKALKALQAQGQPTGH